MTWGPMGRGGNCQDCSNYKKQIATHRAELTRDRSPYYNPEEGAPE